jgi:OOP family OmpA-OmpF porin
VVQSSCDCWLNFIFFAANSSRIQAHQRQGADDNCACLKACSAQQPIELVGHADDLEQNPTALGLARAEEVKRYLVARGFAAGRLRVRSEGNRRSLRPGKSERARQQNRRVEFVVSPP